jgi:uncharacterized membrane protein
MRLFAAALRPYGLSPFGSHRLRAAAAIAGRAAIIAEAIPDMRVQIESHANDPAARARNAAAQRASGKVAASAFIGLGIWPSRRGLMCAHDLPT